MNGSIAVVIAGYGRVGQALYTYLKDLPRFSVKAILRSNTQLLNLEGLRNAELSSFQLRDKTVIEVLNLISQPSIVVDATSDAGMLADWSSTLQCGHYLVSANKLPLCGPYHQTRKFFEESSQTGIEATVGAGLPIIRTIKTALESGDSNIRFEGCFSGTLAYIFYALKQGVTFSDAVREAHLRGYTEADPREDLGANDLARKALILNRVLGGDLELSDIRIESLISEGERHLSLDQFMSKLDVLNLPEVASRMSSPRFLARGSAESAVVELVDDELVLPGAATDNDFTMRSNLYPDGIRIFGPGAGPQVTAMGLLADLNQIALTRLQF